MVEGSTISSGLGVWLGGEHSLLVWFLGVSSCGKKGNGVSLAKWPDFGINSLHSLSHNLWSLQSACQGEWDHQGTRTHTEALRTESDTPRAAFGGHTAEQPCKDTALTFPRLSL